MNCVFGRENEGRKHLGLRKVSAKKEEEFDATTVIGLRERFQYGTETVYQEQEMKTLTEQTKQFIEKTKIIIRA